MPIGMETAHSPKLIRKSQWMRLIDMFGIGPLMMTEAFRNNPTNLERAMLFIAGMSTTLFGGGSFFVNRASLKTMAQEPMAVRPAQAQQYADPEPVPENYAYPMAAGGGEMGGVMDLSDLLANLDNGDAEDDDEDDAENDAEDYEGSD